MPASPRQDQRPCTCGHQDSDGRMDVLRCPVHGVGPEAMAETDAILKARGWIDGGDDAR